jgi:hypothetical protein
MNDPPIPFIAYFFITVTAGTLAYATFTDRGVEEPSTSENTNSDEIKESENPEQTEEQPIDMQNSEKPTEQEPSAPQETNSENPQEQQPSENKSMLPQMSLSNPFSTQNPQEAQAQPEGDNKPKETKGFFETLGLATKPTEKKGGKSKKRSQHKNNKTKKNKGGKKIKKKVTKN